MEGEQPSWNYPTFELNSASDCFFNPNFEHPMDQNDPLESALSSLVSSPAASNAGEGYVIRDVIGKLGSICNSGEVSPQSCIAGSRNTSCYNTPLNSPPKLNLSSVIESQIRGSFAAFGGENQLPSNLGLAPLNADPGFVERAAKFSCFGSRNLGAQFGSELGYGSLPKLEPVILSQVCSAQEILNPEKGDSREGSSVSEQNPGGESAVKPQINTNSRKRKSNPKSKAPVKETKVGAENDESSNAKRSKSDEDANKEKSNTDAEETKKEAPKDYIHVRARRGQATDSHSLAERVRREKISERMKFLQDLVPGCNKVTGKAVVLDEIINYVQSLQRQVEFLSMKLSTVNPRMDFNMEALLSKDMLQLPHNMLPLDSSAPVFPYSFQTTPFSVQLHSTDEFGGSAPQIPAFWEDDLHSLVQMGFPQHQLQTLQGENPSAQMKIEQ